MGEITIDIIREKVKVNDVWVERAILAIYNLQTGEEKVKGKTLDHNGVGFNAVDDAIMGYCANYLIRGFHLSGKFLEKAHKIMPKYAKQLYDISKQRVS